MRESATIAIVLLLLLLSLPGCPGAADEAKPTQETFTVKRGDLKVTLKESGVLQARNRVDIRPQARAVILSIVEEGKIVKEGDVLAELDKESVQKDIEKLEDDLIQLESDLKSARTDLEIQIAENESDVEQASLKLRFAGLELERYEQGDYPLELRDRELKLEQARDKYEKMPQLLKDGFVTQVEVEEKKLAFESAELQLELYKKYTHPMAIEQKQSNVTEAERELSRVKARAEARFEARSAVVRQRERQHEIALQKLQEQRDELSHLTIVAPQSGIVIYGGKRDRRGDMEEEVKVGGMAYPGRTLIELPDLSLMDVSLQVHQADINKLRKGLPALITFPDKSAGKHRGTVSEIGSVAQSTSWRDPVRRFDVVVQIDDRVEGLRAGVTVEVEINLGDIDGILYVPVQAIASTGAGFSVYVLEGGTVKRRRVKLGRSNEQFVQVLEGLAEGDEALLTNPDVLVPDEEGDAEALKEKPTAGGRPNGGGTGQPSGERPNRGGNGRPAGGR